MGKGDDRTAADTMSVALVGSRLVPLYTRLGLPLRP